MKNYLITNDRNNGFDLFNDVFDDFFKPSFYGKKYDAMKTDIKENDDAYVMEVDVPGYDKKDINLTLENGYLTISAKKTECEKDCTDDKHCKKDTFIRRERYCSASRTFYVGDVNKDSLKAKYENGVLTIEIPKAAPELPAAHTIAID